LIDAGRPDRVKLAGLKPDRVPVLAGGYSVLAGVFKAMDIEELLPAKGSLRHGVLYQLLDRRMGSDARDASVTSLARRFAIDFAHADQVKAVAQGLFAQIQPANTTELDRKLLAWAALTHELGFAVSHGNYHRHSAYIIANSDLSGFAPQEQQWLAELVLAHRGNLQKVADAFGKHEHYVQQIAALRLAAIICHAREPLNARQIKAYSLQQKGKMLSLTVAKAVADRSRETIHLLREEVVAWKDAGYRVVVSA
jgi:exopolyphosphatase / guanosine-5'-triphosphate,3'-diphosphate pyrophosphatase